MSKNVTPSPLKAAEEEVERLLEAAPANNSGFYMYSFVDTKGASFRIDRATCYNNIYSTGSFKNREFFIDASMANSKNNKHVYDVLKAPAIAAYIKYIVNDSFFAPCIVTKDIEQINKGVVIFDCNYAAPLVVSAAIALRAYKYYADWISGWVEFQKHIPPDVALAAAHIFKRHLRENIYMQHYYQSWFNNAAYRTCIKMLMNKTVNTNWPTLKETVSYRPLNRLFNCDKEASIPMYNYPMPRGEQFTIKNSFGKAVHTVGNTYTIGDMPRWINEYVDIHMSIKE